jgi:hypothetical protein
MNNRVTDGTHDIPYFRVKLQLVNKMSDSTGRFDVEIS